MCNFEQQVKLTPFFCDSIGGQFIQSDEGFYCFERKDNVQRCAHFNNTKGKPAAKGTTRDGYSGQSKLPESARKVLENFYAPYNRDFEEEFKLGFDWLK